MTIRTRTLEPGAFYWVQTIPGGSWVIGLYLGDVCALTGAAGFHFPGVVGPRIPWAIYSERILRPDVAEERAVRFSI